MQSHAHPPQVSTGPRPSSNPRSHSLVPGVAFSCQSQIGRAVAVPGKVFSRGLPPVSVLLKRDLRRRRLGRPSQPSLALQGQAGLVYTPALAAAAANTSRPRPFLAGSGTNLSTSSLRRCSRSGPPLSRRRPRPGVQDPPTLGRLLRQWPIRLALSQAQAPPPSPSPASSRATAA